MKCKRIFALSISLISLGLNSCTNPIDILFPSSSTPTTSLTQSSSHSEESHLTSSSTPTTSLTTSSSQSEESHLTSSELNYDGIEFHFLTLGNYKAGDSTLIKSGDVEILIDAGSSTSSIDTLKEHINSYCSDGKLEYVIATHAHEDHIAAFTSTSSKKGIFESYEIGTIIDYALTDKTTQIKTKYEEYRQKAVEKGAIHHDASYYFTNEVANEFNSIKISETITMDILYNKYYFEHSQDENNYSVCIMINQGDNHFLLTGDLEKDGEEEMVKYYSSRNGLPHVKLFKGGHHGSNTSSNEALLSIITPEVCAVCCCAGTNEYTPNTLNQFPTQAFIDRIAKYTTNVFVTSRAKYDEDGNSLNDFEDLNGVISVYSSVDEFYVSCSKSNTVLKDSEWFNSTIRRRTKKDDEGELGVCRTWPDIKSMYDTVITR